MSAEGIAANQTAPLGRRVAVQWYSMSSLARLLDFSPAQVRAWFRAGEFGPPAGEAADGYFFVHGQGRGADVRISQRGLEHFLREHTRAERLEPVIVRGRTAGEARRALAAVTLASAV